MNDPERLDRDSASSAYRRRRCPGSPNLIRVLRASGKLPSELPDADAESGTRIHRAWSGATDIELSPPERDMLGSLRRLERLVVTDWAGSEQFTLLGREQRLWLHERLEPVHSGQFDVAYGTLGPRARILIIDGKTGFKKVPSAENNDQLRELVGLARANFRECAEFSVAILQPFFERNATSVAIYDQPEAELCLRQLRSTIADCADPDAPRIPGPWCDYCPAQAVCAEARANANHAYDLAKRIEAGEFELPIGAGATRLLDAIRTAASALEAIRKRYKALLGTNPHAAPGWYLKDGKKVRLIPDALAAYGIAKDFMGMEEFFGATNVSITALREACAKASGHKGKALDEFFNQRFEPVLDWKEYEPELTRETDKSGKKLTSSDD